MRSVSRTMPGCNTKEQNEIVNRARQLLATYDDMAEIIRLGAYRGGSDPLIDEAIKYNGQLEKFLSQDIGETVSLSECYQVLASILGIPIQSAENVSTIQSESKTLDEKK